MFIPVTLHWPYRLGTVFREVLNPVSPKDLEGLLGTVEKALSEATGHGGVMVTASGREAIELILRESGISTGKKIGIPNMICSSVYEAVIRAGYDPELLALNDDLKLDEEAALGSASGLGAIIITHFGGFAESCGRLADYCRNNGILVIHDVCQSQGLEHPEGLLFNKFDCYVYSFGIGKIISGLGGGAISSEDVGYIDRIRKKFPMMVSKQLPAGQLKSYFKVTIATRIFWYALIGRREKAHDRIREISPSPESLKQTISVVELRLILQGLHGLKDNIAMRRAIAARYEEHFIPVGKRPGGILGIVDPVYSKFWIRTKNAKILCIECAKEGIELERINCPLDIRTGVVKYPSDIDRWNEIAGLPISPGVPLKALARISRIVMTKESKIRP